MRAAVKDQAGESPQLNEGSRNISVRVNTHRGGAGSLFSTQVINWKKTDHSQPTDLCRNPVIASLHFPDTNQSPDRFSWSRGKTSCVLINREMNLTRKQWAMLKKNPPRDGGASERERRASVSADEPQRRNSDTSPSGVSDWNSCRWGSVGRSDGSDWKLRAAGSTGEKSKTVKHKINHKRCRQTNVSSWVLGGKSFLFQVQIPNVLQTGGGSLRIRI